MIAWAREIVRRSGLWNNNHVDENYDPAFISLLEHYVNATDPLLKELAHR